MQNYKKEEHIRSWNMEKKFYEDKREWEKRKEEVEKSKPIQISLFGTRATLELVRVNNIISVPHKGYWQSKKPFALLLEKTREKHEKYGDEYDFYCRLGLVELSNEGKLQGGDQKGLIVIGDKNSSIKQYQAQIEIPPKSN